MTLPWVSRRAYVLLEQRIGELESQVRVVERQRQEATWDVQKANDQWFARYEALVTQVGTMVQAGLSVPPTLPEVKHPGPLPAAVEKALQTVAADPLTRRELEVRATVRIAEGVTAEEVAQWIMDGEEVVI